MALSYPIDLLADWPGWATLSLSYGDETSGQAGGQVRVKNLRAPLWSLRAETKPLRPNVLRAWKARLAALENGRKTFLGFDLSGKFPILYPNGAWPTGGSFDGVSAAVHTLGSSISLRLKSLPAGFTVSVGDYLQVKHGSAYGLHQAMEAATADGGGVTPAFEVRPPVRSGFAVNDVVAVKKPSCLMMVVPGSVAAPVDKLGRGTLSFDAIQVVD